MKPRWWRRPGNKGQSSEFHCAIAGHCIARLSVAHSRSLLRLTVHKQVEIRCLKVTPCSDYNVGICGLFKIPATNGDANMMHMRLSDLTMLDKPPCAPECREWNPWLLGTASCLFWFTPGKGETEHKLWCSYCCEHCDTVCANIRPMYN